MAISDYTTALNLDKLTTPKQFISYYFNGLKSDLNSISLRLNRTGIIGYFLNIIGNAQFDTKTYYDFLFNESLPITALKTESLLYHAGLYHFAPGLAKPSTVRGVIRFNLEALSPTISLNSYKQVIRLSEFEFTIGDIHYSMDSEYQIVSIAPQIPSPTAFDNNQYNHIVNIIDSESGTSKSINAGSDTPIPLIGFRQREIDTTFVDVQIYPYGTHHDISLDISNQLVSVEVYVHEESDTVLDNYIKYESELHRNAIGVDERKIYYKIQDNKVTISLGSGEVGRYIPRSKLRIVVTTTKAELGNIGSIDSSLINITKLSSQASTYDNNLNLINVYSNVISNNSFTIKIEEGYGGVDTLKGNNLRIALIKYIQSRNNLINHQDYIDKVDEIFDYSFVLFKKTSIQYNNIYIHISLRNKDYEIVRTDTVDIDWSVFATQVITLPDVNATQMSIFPEVDINGETFISPFVYIRNPLSLIWEGALYTTRLSSQSTVVRREPNDAAYILPLIYMTSSIELDVGGSPTGNTLFQIRSVSDISNLVITVNYATPIDSSGISTNLTTNAIVDASDNTVQSISQVGYYLDSVSFSLKVYEGGALAYELEFANLQSMFDTKHLVSVIKYEHLPQATGANPNPTLSISLLNTPVMHKATFDADRDYYTDNLISNFGKFNIADRMVGDSVQLRFLNTNYLASNYTQSITTQGYNFDITMPFKLELRILFNADIILSKNLSIPALINEVKITIAEKLVTDHTGTNPKFYASDISDILHDLEYIRSVRLKLFDSSLVPQHITKSVNGDVRYYDSEFSLLNEVNIMTNLSKDEMLSYTPMLYHWDLNNIVITYSTESDHNFVNAYVSDLS